MKQEKIQKTKQLRIGHLYGDSMNIYGDNGNILTLKKRCEWRGIKVEVTNVSIGHKLAEDEFDLFFFGGGQDQSQILISEDLPEFKGDGLKKAIERGVPLLSICGGYQLLGEYYQPFDGPKLPGLGIFPAFTKASHDRMIGNLVVDAQDLGVLVGFENHSGKTYLKSKAKLLGKVIKGFGNNGDDQTEGCIYKNAIGCYMHGSLLPKNPKLADWLIKKALEVKYDKKIELKPLNDAIENTAHTAAVKKFS